jgi:hypothetical protein
MAHIIQDDDVEYPILKQLFTFYSKNIQNLVVWSIGFHKGGFECEVADMLNCKIQIFDGRPASKDMFDKVSNILTTHRVQAGDGPWFEKVSKYFIQKDAFTFHAGIPGFQTGAIDLSGVPTQTFGLNINSISKIDFLKIDYPEYETQILYAILNAGYRPGLICIRWDKNPDENTQSMLAAGHLQTCGYALAGYKNNSFLYRFTDDCLYEMCSWSRTDCNYPMLEEYKQQVFRMFTKPQPSTEKADDNRQP